MRTTLLDVSAFMSYTLPLDTTISLKPFIRYLKAKAAEEGSAKRSFYELALERIEQHGGEDADITLENTSAYTALFDQVYACLSPTMTAEQEQAWGLSVPMYPQIFYGTEPLYNLALNNDGSINTSIFTKAQELYRAEALQMIYRLVLRRLYNFHPPLKGEAFSAFTDTATGLLKYYVTDIDTRFVDVAPKGELPELNLKMLQWQLRSGAPYDILEEILPLELFQFSGISIITLNDVTATCVLENIRNVTLTNTPENEITGYNEVVQSLKTLVQNDRIEFEVSPFLRVNSKPVYGYEKGRPSLILSVWGEKRFTPESFTAVAEGYFANPVAFFSRNIDEEDAKQMTFLNFFKEWNVCSLALLPVFYNKKAMGTLCAYTRHPEVFDERTLVVLEPVMPLIAQLLQRYIDEFNLELENVVKEKFTSIQSAVQWKFNEVAWQYLYNRKKDPETAETAPIIFKDVFPLYGAVDIRNSTIERNAAIKADIRYQLTLLTETFTELQQSSPSSLLDEMSFKSRKWLRIVTENQLDANAETNLDIFLGNEVTPFLKHMTQLQPQSKKLIDRYLQAINAREGDAFQNKRSLDASIQLINTAVNNYLESEKVKMQETYPCYFEKFRTDGIEYDIYIGQSIAPTKSFDHFYLKNLRLWQLNSMATIIQLTNGLLPQMPQPLRTTQLIFVHNNTIDISFRNDERKFDVEGAYNIRYQMIKKRIDKVHIRNTQERLTQPDKIALIYFNKKDVEDYREYISYLQETQVLNNDLEELELEDLQGISGLKALRVGAAPVH